jgi:hypothetical protein
MLEGLDKIDWSRLGHAYGSAEDVPDLLRQLASEDADERESAMYELHGNIWHQGTVYQATAAAVPFLIEVLAESDLADRPGILIFLSELANGGSYCDVHQHLTSFKAESETHEWKAQLAKELERVRQTHEAVKVGKELYLAFLTDGDDKEREAAGFLLATLEGPNPETAATLWNQYEREKTPHCRASLLLGLGRASLPEVKTRSLLLNAFVQTQPPSERLAAAVSLAQLFPDDSGEDILAQLLSALLDTEMLKEFDASPWALYGMDLTIEEILLRLKGKSLDYVVRELEISMSGAPDRRGMRSAGILIGMAFREPLRKETTLESLTDRQKRVIAEVARHKAKWVAVLASTRVEDPEKMLLTWLSPSNMVLRKLLDEARPATSQVPGQTGSFWSSLWRRSSRS